MKSRLCLVAALLVIATAGCSTTVSIDTNHDPQADFFAYSSYAWIIPDRGEGSDQTLPDHLDRRLRRVVAETLAEKGFEPAPALPQADLLIVYYAGLETELRVTGVPYGVYRPYTYGYWSGYPFTATSARRYAKGTVVLDFIDRKSKQMVWTGTMTSAVRSSNPPGDRIAEVIEQLLADFPPE